jgi:hypothetical protein
LTSSALPLGTIWQKFGRFHCNWLIQQVQSQCDFAALRASRFTQFGQQKRQAFPLHFRFSYMKTCPLPIYCWRLSGYPVNVDKGGHMKRHFQQEKDDHCAGPAGIGAQIASVLTMLCFCCAFTPNFAAAGETLLVSACGLVKSGFDMQDTFSGAPDRADTHDTSVRQVCVQKVGDIAALPAGLGSGPCDQAPMTTSHTSVNSADSVEPSNMPMMVALPTTDRHWCMAKAFNAAQDRKKLHVVMQQPAVVVIR